jgi:ketosteroid isomerase-like protein
MARRRSATHRLRVTVSGRIIGYSSDGCELLQEALAMTRDDVAGWLDRYADAWRTYDRDAIRGLFSADAEYRYHPWDEPLRGADAIADDWLRDPDAADTYEGRYEPYAVEGDHAVGVGTSRYTGETPRTFHNVFLLDFEPDGACRSFTELYVEER